MEKKENQEKLQNLTNSPVERDLFALRVVLMSESIVTSFTLNKCKRAGVWTIVYALLIVLVCVSILFEDCSFLYCGAACSCEELQVVHILDDSVLEDCLD